MTPNYPRQTVGSPEGRRRAPRERSPGADEPAGRNPSGARSDVWHVDCPDDRVMSSERAPRERPAAPSGGHRPEGPRKRGRLKAFGIGVSKTALWVFGGLIGLILLLVIASFFVDEPMRRSMEREMNR